MTKAAPIAESGLCDSFPCLCCALLCRALPLLRSAALGLAFAVPRSAVDSIMPLAGWVAANLLIGKQQPVLMGNDNFTAAPSGTFLTKDGFINIAANKQEQWETVADLMGVPELKTDPRFQERDSRKKNRKALTPLLEVKLKEKETAYWVELLNKNDVPSGAILRLEAALNQPQVQHRQTLQPVSVEGVRSEEHTSEL